MDASVGGAPRPEGAGCEAADGAAKAWQARFLKAVSNERSRSV
jgi:hypothetical protein